MSSPCNNINLYTQSGKHLTPQEKAFIDSYVACKNLAQAVVEAGYKSKEASTKNISGWSGEKGK